MAQRGFVWTLFHSQCTQLIVAAVIVSVYCPPIYIPCQSNIDAPLTRPAPTIAPVALAAALLCPRCPKMIPNVSQESCLTHRQIRRGRCWPWTEGMPRVRSKGASILSLFCVSWCVFCVSLCVHMAVIQINVMAPRKPSANSNSHFA